MSPAEVTVGYTWHFVRSTWRAQMNRNLMRPEQNHKQTFTPVTSQRRLFKRSLSVSPHAGWALPSDFKSWLFRFYWPCECVWGRLRYLHAKSKRFCNLLSVTELCLQHTYTCVISFADHIFWIYKTTTYIHWPESSFSSWPRFHRIQIFFTFIQYFLRCTVYLF
jgi:hypothetical protein